MKDERWKIEDGRWKVFRLRVESWRQLLGIRWNEQRECGLHFQ
jgi:hypothetical protein